MDDALAAGVGGFILFGGRPASVERLITGILDRAPHPLLIGSDLERGLGQQVRSATALPPAAALASLDDLEVTRYAGYLTAVEACALGINWIFAPVADLDVDPRNPIVSTRSFGRDPVRVAAHVAAWIRGCHDGGGLACAKHFPGHGRTTGDSHIERTLVTADRETLEDDLLPFRAATEAGVDSMMTAHVGYPALDPSGEVATLSPVILDGLLRRDLHFTGLVVSDALGMAGLSESTGEGRAAVAALLAGCDLLLYPENQSEVVDALSSAAISGVLGEDRVQRSLQRVEAAHERLREYGLRSKPPVRKGWAGDVAMRSLKPLRGSPAVTGTFSLIEIDDDLGGPHPAPSREHFRERLRSRLDPSPDPGGAALVAIYAEPRAWKGRSGLSAEAIGRVNEILALRSEALIVIFGHPRIAEEIPAARNVLCAWGGEPLMQEAAAAWLLQGGQGRGSGPV